MGFALGTEAARRASMTAGLRARLLHTSKKTLDSHLKFLAACHVMLALALLATSSANDDGLDEQRAIGAQRFKLKEQLSALRIKYRKDETTEALEEKLRKHTLEVAQSQTKKTKKKRLKLNYKN